MNETSCFFTFLPAFGPVRVLDLGCPNRHVVVAHCCFNLHFPADVSCGGGKPFSAFHFGGLTRARQWINNSTPKNRLKKTLAQMYSGKCSRMFTAEPSTIAPNQNQSKRPLRGAWKNKLLRKTLSFPQILTRLPFEQTRLCTSLSPSRIQFEQESCQVSGNLPPFGIWPPLRAEQKFLILTLTCFLQKPCEMRLARILPSPRCLLWVIFYPWTPTLHLGYKFPLVLVVFNMGPDCSPQLQNALE